MTKKKTAPKRATASDVDALHSALADAFAAELARCREKGETPSAPMLSQIRQFLADNGCDTPIRDSRFDRLRGEIPDMDTLENPSCNVVPLTRASS